MTEPRDPIEREALSWLARINDADFADWEAWDAWRAADARHDATYWRLAAAEADIVEGLTRDGARRAPVVRPAARTPILPRTWLAAAAVLFALLLGAGWIGWVERPRPWTVETPAGEARTLALADGSTLHLAGGTRVVLDRRDARRAELDTGRALFEVVHDPAHPFVVQVGDAVLTDLGTTFDVTRFDEGTRVAVSEGVVQVDLAGRTATLQAGDAVMARPDALQIQSVATESVAAWRDGRLIYRNERIAVVAQDVARLIARPIIVSPAVADRRFTGSLSVAGSPQALRPRLSALLGVAVVDAPAGWRIEAAAAE